MNEAQLLTRERASLCIGNSHAAAFVDAAAVAGVPLTFLHTAQAVKFDRGGRPRISHACEAAIEAAERVVTLIGGNTHNVVGLTRTRRPFVVHYPGMPPPLLADGQVIPHRLMHDIIRRRSKWLPAISVLGKRLGQRMVQLESPPPIADAAYITNGIREPMLAIGRTAFEVNPASLRRRLWRIDCDVIAQTCAEAGVTYLESPPQGMDEAGYLRPEFWGNPTHANSAYGSLLLKDWEAHIRDASV